MSSLASVSNSRKFESIFKRLEIPLFVLQYYDYCYTSSKLWKHLCHFTRTQILENEEHFINQISSKEIFKLEKFNEKTTNFLVFWLRYFKLEIAVFEEAAQGRFLEFLEGLGVGVREMWITTLKLRQDLPSYPQISEILLKNLPLKVLINLPSLLDIKKKAFVKTWQDTDLESTQINILPLPWLKLLKLSNYPSLSSLTSFLSKISKPVRYINICECGIGFQQGEGGKENDGYEEESFYFQEEVGEVLKQIHISCGVMGSSLWNTPYTKEAESSDVKATAERLVRNMNQVLREILRAINFETMIRFEANTDIYYELANQAPDELISLKFNFKNPDFRMKFKNTIYELNCDKMSITVRDREAKNLNFIGKTPEEMKEGEETKEGFFAFELLNKCDIINPRVKRIVHKDTELNSDKTFLISTKYLSDISVELKKSFLVNYGHNSSKEDPLKAEIMSQLTPIPTIAKLFEKKLRFNVPPRVLRAYPDLPYIISKSFPECSLEVLQCEFWDYQLISLHQTRNCSVLDIEIDKDANSYFYRDVGNLPINPYCKELYLRVHQEVTLKETLTSLLQKCPNLEIFKFWSLSLSPSSQKYVDWITENCPKLEELHLKNYIWKKNVFVEKA